MANLYNTFDQINSSISGVNNFFDFTSSTASLTGANLTISGANTTINGSTSLTLKDGGVTTAFFQQSTTTIGGDSQNFIFLDGSNVSIDGSSIVAISNSFDSKAVFSASYVSVGGLLNNQFGLNSIKNTFGQDAATNEFGVLTNVPFVAKTNHFGSSKTANPFPFTNYFGYWNAYAGTTKNYFGKGNLQMFNYNTDASFRSDMNNLDLQIHFEEVGSLQQIRLCVKNSSGQIRTATLPTTALT